MLVKTYFQQLSYYYDGSMKTLIDLVLDYGPIAKIKKTTHFSFLSIRILYSRRKILGDNTAVDGIYKSLV